MYADMINISLEINEKHNKHLTTCTRYTSQTSMSFFEESNIYSLSF